MCIFYISLSYTLCVKYKTSILNLTSYIVIKKTGATLYSDLIFETTRVLTYYL